MAEKPDITVKNHNDSMLDRFRHWGESLFNNIDQINFFGRLKDVSKILEAVAVGTTIYFTGRTARDEKDVRIRVGRTVDAINGAFQIGLSYLSNWDDKIRTVRTYEKLVKEELGLDRQVTFGDLKHSNNPMICDTAAYYSRKSLYRLIPDLFNFIRFVPLGAKVIDKTLGTNSFNAISPLEEVPGITASLGAKAVYFGWYFTERQTGSHYVLQSLWNKTEGISSTSNRGINQNFEPGDFVRWQEVRKLYECLRKEQPQMKLAEYTVDDPLTSRVFEQVARYLNHSYVPKIFAIAEQKEKQNDLQDKYLSHAMLIDLIGSGGLRVEDAIGSSIRLEIMAHYGNKDNIGPGIKKMHEAEKMLSKIHRPKLTNYATTDQGAEALHTYLTQMSNVAEHFLGDAWPTRYFEKEIKPGYIEYFFGGKLPQDKMDYLMDTLPTPPAPEKTPEKTWAENRVTETPLTDKFTATTRHVDHTIPIAGGVPAIGA